jgi:hypothetical protein
LKGEGCGVVVLGAAMDREFALEMNMHGHLTRSLVEGLSGKAGKRERDGCVYLHHLVAYVKDRVVELSNDRQHPSLGHPTIMKDLGLSKPGAEK